MQRNKSIGLVTGIIVGLGLLALSLTSLAAPKSVTITKDNTVVLDQEIDSNSVANTIQALDRNKSPEVILFINSPGGSIFDGIALVNYLQQTDKKIVCVASYAASMAHAILEACPVRLGTSSNVLMQHRAKTQMDGSPNDIQQQLKILAGVQLVLDTMEAKRIGISVEELSKRAASMWITFGEESLKEHLLDGIVEVRCQKELYSIQSTRVISTMFGPIDEVSSGCPLVPKKYEAHVSH